MQFTRTLKNSSRIFLQSDTFSEKWLAISFLLIIFAQNPPWPIWAFQTQLLTLSVIFGLLLTTEKGISYFRGAELAFVAISFGFLYFFVFHGLTGTFRLSSAIFFMTVFLIFRSSTRSGALAFDLISYSFSAILLISLSFWLLWQLGVPLPSSPISYGEWKGADVSTELDNFYIFVSESQVLINRFYSVFDEPGVVGTLAAIILCGLRFDFSKKRSWIVLVGGLCSWSLAFVVLSIIGLMLLKKGRKMKLVILVIIFLVIVAAVILIGSVLPSNDSAGLLLLYRIANFSEYGVSSRTDDSVNAYFFDYINSLRFLFGEGTSFFESRPELLAGQGAIFYVIEYGLIGMIFLLMSYFAIIRSQVCARPHSYFLLIIFIISFIQRPHLMTPWQIVLFWTILCSWSEAKSESHNIVKKD